MVYIFTIYNVADIQVDEYYPTFLNMAKNLMEGVCVCVCVCL